MTNLTVENKPEATQTTGRFKEEQTVSGYEALWDRTLIRLENRMSAQAFTTWFQPLMPKSFEEGVLCLVAPNSFVQEWVAANYIDILTELLSIEAGSKVSPKVVYEAEKEKPETNITPLPQRRVASAESKASKLLPVPKSNRLFTFENFVEGQNNNFARAAAMAVADSPGERYNPLFIFGGAGVGKTHLASAIAIAAHKKNPAYRITYISADMFISEYVNATRLNKIEEFRYRFRLQTDILIIEDIQFIEGKQATQLEFMHTFNSLQQQNKQIVITADRFPDELDRFDRQIISRLKSGVLADLTPPQMETRAAILRKKAEALKVSPDDNTLFYLAETAGESVRELEGALTTLYAHSSLMSRSINKSLAEEIFGSSLHRAAQKTKTPEDIIKKVAAYYGIKFSDIVSPRKMKSLVLPRYIAMRLCRDLMGMSYPEIGRKFNRDHRTAMNALKSLEKHLSKDGELKKQLLEIEGTLQ